MIHICAQSFIDADRYAMAHGLRHTEWRFVMHEGRLSQIKHPDQFWCVGEYKRKPNWLEIKSGLSNYNIPYKEIA
jgi:hypothetical protein